MGAVSQHGYFKMKVVFYNFNEGSDRLASVVSEYSVDNLYALGVIPKWSKYLTMQLPDSVSKFTVEDEENAAKVKHIQFLKFDDNTNPTKIEVDFDLLTWAFKEDIRSMRAEVMNALDSLQLRASMSNRQDIVEAVEKDKQRLRDLPESVDVSNVTTVRGLVDQVQFKTGKTYLNKYNEMFK